MININEQGDFTKDEFIEWEKKLKKAGFKKDSNNPRFYKFSNDYCYSKKHKIRVVQIFTLSVHNKRDSFYVIRFISENGTLSIEEINKYSAFLEKKLGTKFFNLSNSSDMIRFMRQIAGDGKDLEEIFKFSITGYKNVLRGFTAKFGRGRGSRV